MGGGEVEERQQAELEFISSAYGIDEAWCDQDKTAGEGHPIHRVHRRLALPAASDNSSSIYCILILSMPKNYPVNAALGISFSMENKEDNKGTGTPPAFLLKTAYNALPILVQSCQQMATEMIGGEAVLPILNHADEWIEESWPKFSQEILMTATTNENNNNNDKYPIPISKQSMPALLGRRLIYSHHIISKIKRSDMKKLASDYKLTGCIKIGWPGLIIIEGAEEHCVEFYEEIKVWAWKYLVVRGEQQEKIGKGQDLDSQRRFSSFEEETDMSVVANKCREVGLEALFRTSMKQYDNANSDSDSDLTVSTTPYGALIHVDHMNNEKAYRKWLRKTASLTDVLLVIKQIFPNYDFSKHPTILVGIVGEQENVSDFMKRWRTSRVDVDSKGKACLERRMTVVVEGSMEDAQIAAIEWDRANTEDTLNIDKNQWYCLLEVLGISRWMNESQHLFLATSDLHTHGKDDLSFSLD